MYIYMYTATPYKAARSGERGVLSAGCFSHCNACSLLLIGCIKVYIVGAELQYSNAAKGGA